MIFKALSQAGDDSTYQKRLIFLLSLQRISIGFLFTAFPFLFRRPQFQCRVSEEDEFFSCEPNPINCNLEIQPVPDSELSLITQFGLYCASEGNAGLPKNLFTAACSIGILLIFPLADRLGRKPSLLWSYVIGAISLALISFMSNWTVFLTLLTIGGLGISPYLTNSFLLVNESSGDIFR